MFRLCLAFLLSTTLFLLAGCSSNPPSAEAKAPTVKIKAGTWAGEIEGATITLSLADNGRFQTVFRGGKYRSVVKGRAEIVGKGLTLVPTEFDGAPPATTSQRDIAKFTVGESWTTLTSEDGLELKRKI